MGFRAGFYALILLVGLLGAMGLGLIGQGEQKSGFGTTVVLAGDNGGDNNGGDNNGGDNEEVVVVQVITATPVPATATPVPPPPTPVPPPAAPAVVPAPPAPPPAPVAAPPPAATPTPARAVAPAQAPRQLPRTGEGDFALYGLVTVGVLMILAIAGAVIRRRRST
jgi:outer membrane biosynthesis protein TonB